MPGGEPEPNGKGPLNADQRRYEIFRVIARYKIDPHMVPMLTRAVRQIGSTNTRF